MKARRVAEMSDNIVKCAIEDLDVKDRRWAIIEECDASKKRMMKSRGGNE